MKIFNIIWCTSIYFLFMNGFLCAQALSVGTRIGPTMPIMSAIITANGVEETKLSGTGDASSLIGFHGGIICRYDLMKYLTIRGELSYELIRFNSNIRSVEVGMINHVKAGLLFEAKVLKNFGLTVGGEIAKRSNSSTGRDIAIDDALNGLEVRGTYWQWLTGIQYEFNNGIQIDLRAIHPRIQSLTRRFIGDITDNRLIVEQLRNFQLGIEIPILKKN